MKNFYGLMGFAGFITILGGAGGAENASFATTVSVMTFGLVLLLLSLLLVKSHNMRMRKKRQLLMQKKIRYRAEKNSHSVSAERKVPAGIKAITCGKDFGSVKINSPELC